MLPLIAGIVSSLLANNLPKIAQGVIDKGLDVVEAKLGVKLEPDMTPEKIAEIQAAAQKHEEFRIEQENKNTADARDMQKAALAQNDVMSKRFVYYFASFWSICSALYIGFITFGNIPAGNVRFADTILGFILGTVIATILNYFYGSSSGSTRKTDIMAIK
jgi:hypothetical protein